MSFPPSPSPPPPPSRLLLHHHHHPPFHPAVITTTTAVILMLCIIAVTHSPQVSCFNDLPQQSSSPNKGLLVEEEKTRLGSTPPSCHNKCNSCHPCMAVQVPTVPSHARVQPGPSSRRIGTTTAEFSDPYYYPPGNRYSNYKPLGWKCRCGDHLYNP